MLAHTRTLGYFLKELISGNDGELDKKDVRGDLHSNGIAERYVPKRKNSPAIMEVESYLDDYDNPETYEAANSKDSTNWKKAMESEMNLLREKHTWELIDLPVGTKAKPYEWVYRLKTNSDDSIYKYKAKPLTRVFSQRQGINYSETYHPVDKWRRKST
ncbi:retrovirus-related Pol polyprotein from transposon TNT 1-94 [Trichonephila inaurata madagascariensis]|uniref:Retrovirus-related Pol polyprotein from transposon TNT 1-94 n=1 Tax=Trichonephila inaurata madagascariensis TaxID=2747483 RepID=A0A8X6XY94_9ARAC|nr:retrovirus-related Pol polyprotein from transposon TNT 1-94 [Trichonephila inaurata madagascariensis]